MHATSFRKQMILFSICSILFSCRPRHSALKDDPNNNSNFTTTLDLRAAGDGINYAVQGGTYVWTKFIRMKDGRLWFQNTNTYPHHYNFASAHIPEFRGKTNQEFDQKTLFNDGRIANSGGVLINLARREIGLDLVSTDVLPVQEAIHLLKAAREKIQFDTESPYKIYYMPSGSQRSAAAQDSALYESAGFPLANVSIWETGDACYSRGWAVGRLVHIPTSDIDNAFGRGDLKPTDILLTDDVPAEIPVVAGIISKQPATRNSHVAILAQSYGVPFVHFRNPKTIAELESLKGKEIYLGAGKENECTTSLLAAPLDAATKEQILSWKKLPRLVIPPMNTQAALLKPVRSLRTNNARSYGGKAANFSTLIRAVPDNTNTEAHAISFQAWQRFMATMLPTGQSLRAEINSKISSVIDMSRPSAERFPPRDIAAVKIVLAEIRRLIEKTALPEDLSRDLINGLSNANFSQSRAIRFRSSTNVEDSDQFTGAGLYESKSGCLGDDVAPMPNSSRCDQTANKKKPVVDAIRKVFASFYNDNAFFERLRRQVDERAAGMALLVHYSSPDEFELANSVATVTVGEYSESTVFLVSQIGAESVTNPTPGNEPELSVSYYYADPNNPGAIDFDSISDPHQKEKSGRLRQGEWVYGSANETKQMVHLILKAGAAFASEKRLRAPYTLDLEVKKQKIDGNPKLILKQIRPVPKPIETHKDKVVVIGGEHEFCPLMSGSTGPSEITKFPVYANLQSRFHISLRTGLLENLQRSGAVEFLRGNRWNNGIVNFDTRQSGVSGTPNPNDSRGIGEVWNIPEFGEPLALKIMVDSMSATDSGGPAFVHFGWYAAENTGATSDYSSLRVSLSWANSPEVMSYISCDFLKARSASDTGYGPGLSGPGGITTELAFSNANGAVDKGESYKALFFGARIHGITAEPIELKSPFAVTYAASHHNFDEFYLYEPFKDSNVTASQLEALRRADIRSIIDEVTLANGHKRYVVGVNGVLRQL